MHTALQFGDAGWLLSLLIAELDLCFLAEAFANCHCLEDKNTPKEEGHEKQFCMSLN